MTTQATFIAEVQEALRKRGKAIRHRGRKVSIERVIERTDGKEWEKLEIDCPLGATRARLLLHVWEDRWIRIRADRPGKTGWVWQYDEEGRLPGSQSARGLVQLFEESLSAGYWDEQAPTRLTALWKPVLAKAPQPV